MEIKNIIPIFLSLKKEVNNSVRLLSNDRIFDVFMALNVLKTRFIIIAETIISL